MFFNSISSFLCAEIEYIQLSLKYSSEDKQQRCSEKHKESENFIQLQWSFNKIDLIELAYALYHSKAINDGDISVKCIVEAFEQLFNIDLGKYYRAYTDITRRKVIRSKFLRSLIKIYEEKFNELDGK